jgi:hypothetical protein
LPTLSLPSIPPLPTQPFLHKPNDFFTSINCTLENGLTVRNISSFYNKLFTFFVQRYLMILQIYSLFLFETLWKFQF